MVRSAEHPVYPLLSDLNVMLLTGGWERTEAEYQVVYRAAGFDLTKMIANDIADRNDSD